MTENLQALISTNQVAELLRKSPRTIQRQAAAGRIPAIQMPTKKGAFVFRLKDIEALAPSSSERAS